MPTFKSYLWLLGGTSDLPGFNLFGKALLEGLYSPKLLIAIGRYLEELPGERFRLWITWPAFGMNNFAFDYKWGFFNLFSNLIV